LEESVSKIWGSQLADADWRVDQYLDGHIGFIEGKRRVADRCKPKSLDSKENRVPSVIDLYIIIPNH
jgi:hypothetical protein